MTTLSHVPDLPAPNRQVALTFTLTQTGSDFIRVWCTIAPTGSRLDNEINSASDPRNRVIVFEGAPGSSWNYSFDKGGKYTFVAQEYTKGSGYGGGYEGDPNSAATEIKVGAETTLTLFVGQRVTAPIGPPSDQATLVLWVWDDTIYSTTKAFHGEDSPAIVAPSPTPRVRTAIESSTVVSALATLDGRPVDLVLVDIRLYFSNYAAVFNDHIVDASAHANIDDDNTILDSFAAPTTQKGFIDSVNQAIVMARRHMTNDMGAMSVGGVVGPDSGNYHNVTGSYFTDHVNLPLYDRASDYAQAYGAFADLHRGLIGHIFSADAHIIVKPVNLLSPPPLDLPALLAVHEAFCAVLAEVDPTVPPAQSSGAQLLISGAGFKES